MFKINFIPTKKSLSLTVSLLLSLGFNLSAKADTTDVRCDFYPKGEDKATRSTSCTFSQRQGFVGITKPNGARYDFKPDRSQAGLYTDLNGNKVTREINGDIGLIFRTDRESIFIYWDDNTRANNSQTSTSSSSQPKTYTTVQDFNNIAIQITEGEFYFYDILERTSSNIFTGSDEQVRVSLDPYSGRVVVINKVTGTEFYNYYIPPVSGVGEDPSTMCNPATEPC